MNCRTTWNMRLFLRNAILCLVVFWFYLLDNCSLLLNKRVVMISLERPAVVDVNNNIARVLNVTSRRFGRSDPVHYIQIWIQFLKPIDNTSRMDIQVYEFLSNEYRPTFVQTSLETCFCFNHFLSLKVYYTSDLSKPVTPYDIKNNCYFKPGFYHYANLTLPISNFPENFPFEKGRVFMNHTYRGNLIMGGRVDIELKMLPRLKYKGVP